MARSVTLKSTVRKRPRESACHTVHFRDRLLEQAELADETEVGAGGSLGGKGDRCWDQGLTVAETGGSRCAVWHLETCECHVDAYVCRSSNCVKTCCTLLNVNVIEEGGRGKEGKKRKGERGRERGKKEREGEEERERGEERKRGRERKEERKI